MKKIILALSLLLVFVLGYSTISVHATEPTTETTTTEAQGPIGIIKEFSNSTTTHDFDFADFLANMELYTWWVWDGQQYAIASNGIKYETLNVNINGSIVPFYTASGPNSVYVTDKKTTSVYIDFSIMNDGTVSNVDGFIDLYKDPFGKIYITSDDIDLNAYFASNDSLPPSFTGSAQEMLVSKNVELNIETIKQYIQYTDNVDEENDINLTVVSNTYSGKESTAGTYSIVFKATDKAENSAQHTITIKVIYDLSELYIVDGQDVYVTNSNPIAESEVEIFLKSYSFVTTEDDFTVSILNNEYFLNSTVKGDYIASIKVTYLDTITETFNLTFHVLDNLIVQPSILDSLTTLQKVLGSTLGASIIAGLVIVVLKNTNKIKRNKRRR